MESRFYLVDPDGTEKFVFNDENGVLEIVRINTKHDRDIYCVPSMYQCLIGCKMCYLTINKIKGSNKKIPSGNIDEAIRLIREKYPTGKPEIQISIMGVGDPLSNLELVNDICGNEKYSRVSISTVFPLLPKTQFPKKLKIHFSLHSPFEERRKEIIPKNKISLEKILDFLNKHEGEVEYHYTLMSGLNDDDEHLEAVCELMKNSRGTIKFLDYKTSDKTNIRKSIRATEWLRKVSEYTNVEYYYPPGELIQGSCGLFTEGFYTNKPSQEFSDMLNKFSKPIIE